MTEIERQDASAPKETDAATTAQPRETGDFGRKGDDIAQVAANAGETVKDAASDTVESAVREAHAQAYTAKTGVANEMSDVAAGLRVASKEMRSGSTQERLFAQVAESLADVSEAIERKELSEMAEAASDFARRNPLVFLGGAALLGFAASRFAKASGASGAHLQNDPSAARPAASAPMSASDGSASPGANMESAPPGTLGQQVYQGTEI